MSNKQPLPRDLNRSIQNKKGKSRFRFRSRISLLIEYLLKYSIKFEREQGKVEEDYQNIRVLVGRVSEYQHIRLKREKKSKPKDSSRQQVVSSMQSWLKKVIRISENQWEEYQNT